jgi:hypothetical protein
VITVHQHHTCAGPLTNGDTCTLDVIRRDRSRWGADYRQYISTADSDQTPRDGIETVPVPTPSLSVGEGLLESSIVQTVAALSVSVTL